jgi:hypothetical protein
MCTLTIGGGTSIDIDGVTGEVFRARSTPGGEEMVR